MPLPFPSIPGTFESSGKSHPFAYLEVEELLLNSLLAEASPCSGSQHSPCPGRPVRPQAEPAPSTSALVTDFKELSHDFTSINTALDSRMIHAYFYKNPLATDDKRLEPNSYGSHLVSVLSHYPAFHPTGDMLFWE